MEARGTRALLGLVIGLGVLIVAGVLVVVVTLIHRALAPRRALFETAMTAPVAAHVAEPPGSRIVSIASGGSGDWLALLVSGGGLPDRVVLVDPHGGGGSFGEIRLSPEPAGVPH